jgi:hypothetical protein
LNGNLQAAYNYIIKNNKAKSKPERMAFETVYQVYGIDIRNSSVERSQSIQLDFIEQLQMAAAVIKALSNMSFLIAGSTI